MPRIRDDELEVSELPVGAAFYWEGRPASLLERELVTRGRWRGCWRMRVTVGGEIVCGVRVPGELVRVIDGAAPVSR